MNLHMSLLVLCILTVPNLHIWWRLAESMWVCKHGPDPAQAGPYVVHLFRHHLDIPVISVHLRLEKCYPGHKTRWDTLYVHTVLQFVGKSIKSPTPKTRRNRDVLFPFNQPALEVPESQTRERPREMPPSNNCSRQWFKRLVNNCSYFESDNTVQYVHRL